MKETATRAEYKKWESEEAWEAAEKVRWYWKGTKTFSQFEIINEEDCEALERELFRNKMLRMI